MHGGRTRGVSSPRIRRTTRGSAGLETTVVVVVCVASGVLAVAGGAVIALLVPGRDARAVVWVAVTLVLAAAAGLWWGGAAFTARSRNPGRRPREWESRPERSAGRETAADLTKQRRR